MMRILVCYATKSGTAAQLARWLADGMRDAEVDVLNVADVGALDYDLVVLGSPIRFGAIDPAMASFLAERRDELARRPKVVFIVCLVTLLAGCYLRRMCDLIDGEILAYRVFAGRLGPINFANRAYAGRAGDAIRSLIHP